MTSRSLGFSLLLAASLTACSDDSAPAGGAGGGGAPGAGGSGGAPSAGGSGGAPSSGGAGGAGGAAEVFCVDVTTVSFSADVQPILAGSCALNGCHTGVSPDASLSLAEGAAWSELVGAPTFQCAGQRTRVVPMDPGQSYLFAKVRGVDMCKGKRMPPAPPPGQTPAPFGDAEIKTIESWICGGALDD